MRPITNRKRLILELFVIIVILFFLHSRVKIKEMVEKIDINNPVLSAYSGVTEIPLKARLKLKL